MTSLYGLEALIAPWASRSSGHHFLMWPQSTVGGIMVSYVNYLQSLIWWPEHDTIISLDTAIILTCKIQEFHYDSKGRLNPGITKSAPIFVVHIPKNPVNSYDSNSAITVPISALGDEKRNLPFFCLPIFPWTYWVILYIVGKIFSRRTQRR